MYAADEEGPEAERLRLYDVQWLDEPSIAQARIGEEHLIRKHAGLSEDALSTWITKHADVEVIQAGLASSPTTNSPGASLANLQAKGCGNFAALLVHRVVAARHQ